MRQLFATLAALAGIAVAVAFTTYSISRDGAVQTALRQRDALEWLRVDFKLDATRFAAVKRLHESYAVVCEEHCRAIQVATGERNALRATGSADAATVAAAAARVQELRTICETAIAAHVREVAAHMSPAEGRRYLALVLPKIADFDHRAAPDVGVGRHEH